MRSRQQVKVPEVPDIFPDNYSNQSALDNEGQASWTLGRQREAYEEIKKR